MRRGQRTSAEQVVLKLPQIEVQTAQGKSLALAWTEAEISEQSYRWQGVRWPSSRPGQEDQGPGARECSAAAAHGGSVSGGSGAGGRRLGERVAPERRRQAVDGIREKYGLSERHACRVVGQHRGTQRYVPTVLADEDELTRAIIAGLRVRTLWLPPRPCAAASRRLAGGQGPGSAHLASRRIAVGDRVLRKLPWQAARRMPAPGNLLLAEGGTGRDRSMAEHIQPRPAALVSG
jgi:hypothetical protein